MISRYWQFLLRHWEISGPTYLVVGIAGLLAAVQSSVNENVGMAAALVAICVMGVGIAIVAAAQEERRRGTRADQIARLTASLAEALQVIDAIQREVADGQATLARLERDTELARAMATLSDEQAMAVRAQLDESIRKDSRRSFRASLSINIVCLLVGVGATAWFAYR
jgi:hypothetical protein